MYDKENLIMGWKMVEREKQKMTVDRGTWWVTENFQNEIKMKERDFVGRKLDFYI